MKFFSLFCVAVLHAYTSEGQAVTKVSAGSFHSLFLKSDGSLWAAGGNYYGELGDGTYTVNAPYGINQPEQIVGTNVTSIASGTFHSLFLMNDGSLWGMGLNQNGELGIDIYNYETNRAQQIVSSGVTAIAAGGYDNFSLFLKSDGSLWGMGLNLYGELGDGTNDEIDYPLPIVASGVTEVAAGDSHTLFLKNDGSLWGMGRDQDGQLGDGTYTTNAPWGINRPKQIVASDVTAIAGGYRHSLFLKSDGSMWAMGDNSAGQLGDGTNISTNRPKLIVASNVTAIAAGAYHSLFLKTDGSMWAMGDNSGGQFGDGSNVGTNRPKLIVASNVKSISVGQYGFYSMFLKTDGSLWAMGKNAEGELGNGNYNNTNRPVQLVAGMAGYSQIVGQVLGSGQMRLSFLGDSGKRYALDRSFNLVSSTWLPQVTNFAGLGGILVFTNTAIPTTNNFWRIRSVP